MHFFVLFCFRITEFPQNKYHPSITSYLRVKAVCNLDKSAVYRHIDK